MAKQNSVYLYGRVHETPIISTHDDGVSKDYGLCYLDVIRGTREIDDDRNFMKHDRPLIATYDPAMIVEMSTWQKNDMVFIKGVITAKRITKKTICGHCGTENDIPTNLTYVTPIFAEKRASYGEDKLAAIEDLVQHREISNQVMVFGTVLRDPRLVTTAAKKQFVKYPLAMNRKFYIRSDDPSIRTDYPWVVAYGEQGRDDAAYIHFQSEVLVDGVLQGRKAHRKSTCACCNNVYAWDENRTEIVPYAVEYLTNFRTPEEVRAEFHKSVEELKNELFGEIPSAEDES